MLRIDDRQTSRLLRVAMFGGLWAACGFVLFATYQTDACPPEVKHREAIQAGLLTPLVLSANASACIRQAAWQPVAGIGFLLAYGVVAIGLLRSRTITRFVAASVFLAVLSGLGLWCTFYRDAHSGG